MVIRRLKQARNFTAQCCHNRHSNCTAAQLHRPKRSQRSCGHSTRSGCCRFHTSRWAQGRIIVMAYFGHLWGSRAAERGYHDISVLQQRGIDRKNRSRRNGTAASASAGTRAGSGRTRIGIQHFDAVPYFHLGFPPPCAQAGQSP